MTNLRVSCVAALASAFSVVPFANADFVNPLVPAWRGSAQSDFYGWESFTSSFGGPNLPNYTGTESGAALFNFGPGAILTGTGNLYAASGPLFISVYGGLSADAQEVILNLATMGTLLNFSSVRLVLADNSGNSVSLGADSAELRSDAPAPGGQGQIQTNAFSWDLSDLTIDATHFTLEFSSASVNMSLDTVSMDVRYVPAPGAFALVALAGVTGWRARRRR